MSVKFLEAVIHLRVFAVAAIDCSFPLKKRGRIGSHKKHSSD